MHMSFIHMHNGAIDFIQGTIEHVSIVRYYHTHTNI